jgi:hypothetical protein
MEKKYKDPKITFLQQIANECRLAGIKIKRRMLKILLAFKQNQ